MKKLLSVCLALIMVACFSVTAFAEGGFLNSPSLNPAPEVVEPTDEGIEVTPYNDRDSLTDDEKKALEDAYDSIKNVDDVRDLNKDVADGNSSNLAVSDLFNVGYEGNNTSGSYSVALKSDTLNNFTSLMTYVNGKWEIVDGAKVQDGKLMFTAKNLGPYAIVVNTGDSTNSPQTGINETTTTENTSLVVYGALMVVSACGALFMWRKSKKYTA